MGKKKQEEEFTEDFIFSEFWNNSIPDLQTEESKNKPSLLPEEFRHHEKPSVDSDRNKYIYDGTKDDKMSFDYFPDIALEKEEAFTPEECNEPVIQKNKKKHTARNILLTLIILVILAIGAWFLLKMLGVAWIS